eukprot:25074_1
MRTILRFKPSSQAIPSAHPLSKHTSLEIDADSNTAIINKPNGQQLEFNADCVFNTDSTQQSIFQNVGERLINNTLDGFNTTVFAYGQTGSGKTYTMFGDDESEGLAFKC